jgi:hypothetical protein
MRWDKARQFREREEKYDQGKVLTNGRKVYNAPRDKLEKRAFKAEQGWAKKTDQRPYKPTAYDIARDPRLAPPPPKTHRGKDIAMDVLEDLTKPPWED